MSDEGKPEPAAGQAMGKWTKAGVQAGQAQDIEALKAAFALHIADHEAEGMPEDTTGDTEPA